MTENVGHIKELLSPHIKDYKGWVESEDFKELDEERREKFSTYGKLLSKKGISAMTEVEVHELISTLWAFGAWGNKDYLVTRLLKAVDLNKFKQLLTELLWGSNPLRQRYDNFNENVKYLGSAAITEILAFVHPNDCAIWSERIRTGLKRIGLLKDWVDEYWIDGRDYEKICSEYKRILVVLSEEGIAVRDLLDVDLFIYKVSITEERKRERERPEDYDFNHTEVKDKILEVGQYLGFEAEKEVLIAPGAQVDAIWTVSLGNLGVVKYVFEVQRRGSIDSLLIKLHAAKRNPAVQKTIIVSNTEGIKEVKDKAELLGEEFAKSLAYLEAEDIRKVAESLKEAWDIISSLELVKST